MHAELYELKKDIIHPFLSLAKGTKKTVGEWMSIFTKLQVGQIDFLPEWFQKVEPKFKINDFVMVNGKFETGYSTLYTTPGFVESIEKDGRYTVDWYAKSYDDYFRKFGSCQTGEENLTLIRRNT